MSNTTYKFLATNSNELIADLTAKYEALTGIAVQPSSPVRLFIQWIASILIQERILANYAANQNIPSRASGENLDALAELFHNTTRPDATAATSTVRFTISESQTFAVLIPKGTRVTDKNSTYLWETTEDKYISVGETSVDIPVRCQTTGTAGNGFVAGQLNTVVDLFAYCQSCTNLTVTDGGSDQATDAEFCELLRLSMDAYSCAGAKGGYIYFAKQTSTEIVDVVANTPQPGHVALYLLMHDGSIAPEQVKQTVLTACSADDVRPLTDLVSVNDPEVVEYDIQFIYYIPTTATHSTAQIQTAVEDAVQNYVTWQSGKLGRDINPDKLREYLFATGIKRIVLTSPAFTTLRGGKDNTIPQVAKLRTVTIANGGFEDE